MGTIFHVDVVSAEESIYPAPPSFWAPGEVGELGIYPHHTPLLTRIKPGSVHQGAAAEEEVVHASGGILRQPDVVLRRYGGARRGPGRSQGH